MNNNKYYLTIGTLLFLVALLPNISSQQQYYDENGQLHQNDNEVQEGFIEQQDKDTEILEQPNSQFQAYRRCPNEKSGGCNLRYEWACGRLRDENCFTPPCFISYRNKCIACSDSRVVEFKQGRCEKESQLKLFCQDGNRPQSCNDSQFPVCGYGYLGSRKITFRNECWACRNTKVSFYTKGQC